MDSIERVRRVGRRGVSTLLLVAGVSLAPALRAQTPAAAAQPTSSPPPAAVSKLAETACASCHGAQGQGVLAAGFPRLAGTGGAYLAAQLDAFATGYRKNAVMQPIAQSLSKAQRSELARFYGSLPAPVSVAKTVHLEPDPANHGEWLALRGRWPDGIPPCGQCHGPTGLGVGEDFPPLAGQPVAYLEAQLTGWKQGLRPPGPMALMVLIAGRLNAADIAAVAKYYAELPSAAQTARRAGASK